MADQDLTCRPIVGAGVRDIPRLPGSMRGFRLHRIWYGADELAPYAAIYLPPHVSIDALRKVLPASFRYVGEAGVANPFAGQPVDDWTPGMECFLHEHDLCRPSIVGEAVLNYDALPPEMHGWQRNRIEYGFECACPETTIYLPGRLRQRSAGAPPAAAAAPRARRRRTTLWTSAAGRIASKLETRTCVNDFIN